MGRGNALHNMKSYSTTTREIFTPEIDRFTGGKFKGNHHDMMVSFHRHGDQLTILIFWSKDSAGKFTKREVTDYSIESFLSEMKFDAEKMGLSFSCDDNIPNGFSFPEITA